MPGYNPALLTATDMNIYSRAKNLLLQPDTEWATIAAAPVDTAAVYRNYVMLLAAIGPIASFIGMALVGYEVPILGRIRISIPAGLAMALISYLFGLATVHILSRVIDHLAPRFGGIRDPQRALGLAVYSLTPGWLAGILFLVPSLGLLAILAGLYGIYLLYRGLPIMMESATEKSLPYTLITVLWAMAIQLVASVAIGAVTRIGPGQAPMPVAAVPTATTGLTAEQRQVLDHYKALSESLNRKDNDD